MSRQTRFWCGIFRCSIDGYVTEHHTGGTLFSSLLYLLLALVVLLVLREVFLPLTAAAGLTFRARGTD